MEHTVFPRRAVHTPFLDRPRALRIVLKWILCIAVATGVMFNCSDKKVAGTADDASSGTILGELVTNGATIGDTVTVCLYKDGGDRSLTKKPAQVTAPLRSQVSMNGAYEFDSLSAGTYRIEVTRDSLVVGSADGIALNRNEHKTVNITIVIIINQIFNIRIDESRTVNNFYIENGKIVKTDSGYALIFAAADTFGFQMAITTGADTSTVEVLAIRNNDGTMTFKTVDSTADVAITPGTQVPDKPEILAASDSTVRMRAGEPCTLWVAAQGTGVLEYAWYKDAVRIESSDNDTLILSAPSGKESGNYTCVVKSPWGEITSATMTLTIALQCTVSYIGNGNTGGEVPVDGKAYPAGDTVRVSGNTGGLIKKGHSFAGWNSLADGMGTDYAPNSVFVIDTNKATLYAKWTPDSFTVTFIARGGGNVAPQTVAYGRFAAEPEAPKKAGSTFTGWCVDSAGAQLWVFTRDTVLTRVILYATWSENPTYSVTYAGNGSTSGELPSGAINYEVGAKVTVLGNTGNLEKEEHTFSGWNTAADGNGARRLAGTTFAMGAENVTLYAQWTLRRYSVSFNGNENTGGSAPDTIDAAAGASVTLPGRGSLEKTGCSFTGWNIAADGSAAAFGAGDTIVMGPAPIRFYAQWSKNRYSVTYEGNGHTDGSLPAATGGLFGDEITVPAAADLAKTGYAFSGWNTSADGSGTGYPAASKFTVRAKNDTLFAQWTPNRYTVVYWGNGQEAGDPPGPATYACGATMIVPGRGTMIKTGYALTGWNTAADGSGTNYSVDSSYTKGPQNDTLHAQWSIIRVSVTYNGNGHTAGSPPQAAQYDYGTDITISEKGDLEKTGHAFISWNPASDGSRSDIAPGSSYTVKGENVTFYATWTKNRYTVTYSGNNQTSGTAPDKDTVYFDASLTLPPQGNLQKTVHYFRGWNTASDGTGTNYAAGAAFVMGPVDTVFYAEWEIYRYTVSFNSRGGSVVPPQQVDHGGHAPEPVDPNYAGFAFRGWYKDSACANRWNFAVDTVVKNTALYARWAVLDGDGNEYTAVKVGNQFWTAQNLKTTRFRDNTEIPRVSDSLEWIARTLPAFCWYGNDSANRDVYGGLYNWHTVNSGRLAPPGWHVPTTADWDTLIRYLGGTAVAGAKLKETGTGHWMSPNSGATDETGFTGRGGSGRRNDGWFFPLKYYGVWWASTEIHADSSLARQVYWNDERIMECRLHKRYGIGVRFVRD